MPSILHLLAEGLSPAGLCLFSMVPPHLLCTGGTEPRTWAVSPPGRLRIRDGAGQSQSYNPLLKV